MQPESILKDTSRSLLTPPWLFGLILALVLGCGVFLRFNDLSAPLLDFHPTRQLFGAIKARGLYYQAISEAALPSPGTESTSTNWQRDLAVRQYEGEATIEPPLMENLSAALYASFGEQTSIPRAISASIWLVGGLFLFLLSRNLTTSNLAAACGLAFYLLLPYSVTASRAFQPDPLMVMLLILFWWSMENWGRHTSWKWAVISGISGGLAIFVKFPAAFFVVGAALGVILAHIGVVKALKHPQTWVIVLLGILPPGAYLYYGTRMGGFLDQQFGSRFYPEMWISPFFYLRWLLKLENIAAVPWLALSVLGWLVLSGKPARIFITSLWAAYFFFGMAFSHHISSHDYYSLPLIPIAALGLAQLSRAALPGLLEKIRNARSFQIIVISLCISAILLITVDQYVKQRENDYRSQAAFWSHIGNAIGHQPGVLALTTDYGYPLAYYGWQNSTPWPASVDIDNFDEVFARLASNKDYFLITDFGEYDRQPSLQQQLTSHYPILVQDNTFVLFDLAHPKK